MWTLCNAVHKDENKFSLEIFQYVALLQGLIFFLEREKFRVRVQNRRIDTIILFSFIVTIHY